MGIRLGDGYHSWVPAPDLTVECLPRSLLLQWTLPEWLPSRVVKEFKIYRGRHRLRHRRAHDTSRHD
ncbi:MAG: hypothetical protein BWX84_00472 [Verrucomicrobia bacterium ADurb.Bin118]|jgi:hypothetical protein|nr:MAG: hypothetical protein BWX84_00472 [Verrucomicrobia bacterium ADurb.Bin118]